MSQAENPDTEGEAAPRAVITQMKMSLDRYKKDTTIDPDYLRGYQEAIWKVTHVLGETRAHRIFKERREAREQNTGAQPETGG